MREKVFTLGTSSKNLLLVVNTSDVDLLGVKVEDTETALIFLENENVLTHGHGLQLLFVLFSSFSTFRIDGILLSLKRLR